MEREPQEEQSEAVREAYREIERAKKALAEVDDALFWYGARFAAKILLYVACCLFVYWFLFGW